MGSGAINRALSLSPTPGRFRLRVTRSPTEISAGRNELRPIQRTTKRRRTNGLVPRLVRKRIALPATMYYKTPA